MSDGNNKASSRPDSPVACGRAPTLPVGEDELTCGEPAPQHFVQWERWRQFFFNEPLEDKAAPTEFASRDPFRKEASVHGSRRQIKRGDGLHEVIDDQEIFMGGWIGGIRAGF